MSVRRGYVFTGTKEPCVKISIPLTISEKEWDWLLDKAKRSGWTQAELIRYMGTSGFETASQLEWECDEEEAKG